MIVKVPGTREHSAENLRKIIGGSTATLETFAEFRKEFEQMKAITFDTADMKKITNMAVIIALR